MKTGYSLIELIVVISISSIIIVSLVRLMATAIPVYRSTVIRTMSDETVRVQLKRMSEAIRNSRSSNTGAYPIVEASPNKIVFYTNIDSDTAIERVRYELIGTDLVRGVVKPAGSPLVYDIASEAVVTVARSIRNGSTSLFTYYGKDYSSPASSPSTSIADITYISISFTIDEDPSTDPSPFTVQSQVQLRNLKTNL